MIGFFRPIVLLPMRALTGLTPEQLEAVIAHELGHIKRFDVAVNFFQVIAETLFFFHPAVWWLNKRIRADREDCCDDVAIADCGGTVGYARALATMEGWRDVPSFAMAATGSPVADARRAPARRQQQQNGGGRTAGVVTASLVLATALIAGWCFLRRRESCDGPEQCFAVEQAQSSSAAVAASCRASKSLRTQPSSKISADRRGSSSSPAVSTASLASSTASAPVAPKEPAPAAPAKPPRNLQARFARLSPPNPPAPPNAPSFINEMNAVGLENLDVDELIALRVQDVTPRIRPRDSQPRAES